MARLREKPGYFVTSLRGIQGTSSLHLWATLYLMLMLVDTVSGRYTQGIVRVRQVVRVTTLTALGRGTRN